MSDLIKVGSENGKPLYVPKDQIGGKLKNSQVITYPATSVSSSILGSGGSCNIIIPMSSTAGEVEHSYLRITATVASAAVRPAAAPFWISKLTLYCDQGSKIACELYGDTILNEINELEFDEFDAIKRDMFMNAEYQSEGSFEVGTRTFTIPLYNFALNGLYLGGLRSDLLLKVDFSACLISGTAANITVGSAGVELVCKIKHLSIAEENDLRSKYLNGVIRRNFVTYDRFSNNQNLMAGTQSIIKLNNLQGMMGFVWFLLRSSSAVASNAIGKWVALGDDFNRGSFELRTSNNQQITMTHDARWNNRFLIGEHHRGQLQRWQRYYEIIHGEPDDVYNGKRDGYFYDSNLQLLITPGSNTAEVARVVTLSPGANLTAGGFKLQYVVRNKTYISSILPYNSTTGTVQTAITAMNIPFISVAVSGSALSAGNMVLTITDLREDDLAVNGAYWSVILENALDGAGVAADVSAVDTTAGNPLRGFSSASYDIYVYAVKHAQLVIDRGYCRVEF